MNPLSLTQGQKAWATRYANQTMWDTWVSKATPASVGTKMTHLGRQAIDPQWSQKYRKSCLAVLNHIRRALVANGLTEASVMAAHKAHVASWVLPPTADGE